MQRCVLGGCWCDRRAEEDGPEVRECCDVTCYYEVCEHGAQDVPGPDPAEGKASFGFWCGNAGGGEVRECYV